MNPQAVIFDLDGTLVNTLDDLANAANRTLARHGYGVHPVPAYKDFIGDGAETLIRRALPATSRDSGTVAYILKQFREDYGQNWKVKSAVYPGIQDLLEALASRGLPLAVLSNKPHEYTRMVVEEFFPAAAFCMVLGMRDAVPKKPDPAAALEIARFLSLAPERIVFVGDSATDMQTATAAGMFPVGALWGFRCARELNQAGAQAVIAHPGELVALF